MKCRLRLHQTVWCVATVAVVSSVMGCIPPPSPIEPKVLAFYYPWYGTPWVSGQWVHWNEGGHNPDVFIGDRRDIGATDYPARDVYDSHDQTLIVSHLEEADAAGIDVLIGSWWGIGSFTDVALKEVMDVIESEGALTRLCIYYETVPGLSRDAAVADLTYILTEYGPREAYFKVEGTPVIFVYGRAIGQLSASDWQWVLAQVRQRHEALFWADAFILLPSVPAGFDGVHFYNPVVFIALGADMTVLYKNFVSMASSWGLYSAITVIPGYDDSHIGRPFPIVVGRNGGTRYADLWEAAIAARPDYVLITSYNEWHEGSEIEPSLEYGDTYITSTRTYADLFKETAAETKTLGCEKER